MKATILTAAGTGNPLSMGEEADLEYRLGQLKKLQNEVVDIEDMESVTQTCLKLYECPVDQGEIEEGIRFVKERFCYKTRLDTIKCYL